MASKGPITTLTWGNDHALVLQQREQRTMARLKIIKPNGKQMIPIAIPKNVTVADIVAAWEEQGKKWDNLETSDFQGCFTALRVIWLTNGAITWNVLHFNNEPFDTCGYTALTKEKWSMSF